VLIYRQRQEEKVGPNARIKIRLNLEDIYNGKQMPVRSCQFNINRLHTTRGQSALIVDGPVLSTLMMFRCALIAKVKDRLLKLDALDLVSYSSSRDNAHTAAVKERQSDQNAMFAKVTVKLELLTS
jgi:hypothetical protein